MKTFRFLFIIPEEEQKSTGLLTGCGYFFAGTQEFTG
jgi:hypothetical protein